MEWASPYWARPFFCALFTAEAQRRGEITGLEIAAGIDIIRQRSEKALANADIIIADERLLPQAVELYNQMFRPKRETDFFKRRFMGRYNVLTLLARIDEKPVGFWVGFELKPGMFYHWLGGVVADLRRHGVARQLQEAQQAWAKDHGYEHIRCECMNHQREFIHFAVSVGYDLVGIRWDSTHADNLIVFEKNLVE